MLVFVLASAASAVGGTQQRVASAAPSLVFDRVTIVDVERGEVVPNQRVVISGNHIRAVGKVSAVKLPKGAQVIDARGKYLIPGLWDMHYHTVNKDNDSANLDYRFLIANGITGIRNPSPSHLQFESPRPSFEPVRWQREVAAGTRIGPRERQLVWAWRSRFTGLSATVPAAVQRSIDSVKAARAGFLKISCNGMAGSVCTPDVYFALLAAARRNGLHVAGHPPPEGVTMAQAADSGQRSFEHLGYMMGENNLGGICEGGSASVAKCHALAQALRRRNAWITPTIAVDVGLRLSPRLPSEQLTNPKRALINDTTHRYSSQSFDSAAARTQPPGVSKELVTMLQRAEMPLLVGTDRKILTVHEELAWLVALGLTPLGALQAATLNPARYLEATDSLGTVAEGKLADLVLLDADPLVDITNTATIRAVVANGRYYDRAALDGLLDDPTARPRQAQVHPAPASP